MKKFAIAAIIAASTVLSGCSIVTTEPGTESVLVDKPYIFGEGGVRTKTEKPGRVFTWFSTDQIVVNVKPQAIPENFDDLMTSDTVPVDFKTMLQIEITDPVAIVNRFGIDGWYTNNVKSQYQALVRDEAKKYSMNDLLTGQQSAEIMESNVRKGLDALIIERNLPVRVTDLSIGRAIPNKNVMDQIDMTAQEQQRIKTMREAELAEKGRKAAETARAQADNAYRNEMGMNPSQFVELELAKRYAEACSGGKNNCTFIVGKSGNVSPVISAK